MSTISEVYLWEGLEIEGGEATRRRIDTVTMKIGQDDSIVKGDRLIALPGSNLCPCRSPKEIDFYGMICEDCRTP